MVHCTHAYQKLAGFTCGFCPVMSFPSVTTNSLQSAPCMVGQQLKLIKS